MGKATKQKIYLGAIDPTLVFNLELFAEAIHLKSIPCSRKVLCKVSANYKFSSQTTHTTPC